MTKDLSRRIGDLEAMLLRGPREEAAAIELAENIADALEEMDRVTGLPPDAEPERIDRAELLAYVRKVKGLPVAPLHPRDTSPRGSSHETPRD